MQTDTPGSNASRPPSAFSASRSTPDRERILDMVTAKSPWWSLIEQTLLDPTGDPSPPTGTPMTQGSAR